MTANTADSPPMGAVGPMTTVEALRRVALCRDDEAWGAILLNHGRGILRLAERMVGKAQAEDVCQETLLQIRAHARKFSVPPGVRDAEGAARGWVMCIAYRTALSMLRTSRRRSHRELEAGLQREREAAGPDEALLSAEQSDMVRQEVAELPEVLRGAVCLHYYGELSYADVSSALACSEEVARKRVERGVSELRGRLALAGLALGVAALTGILAGSAGAASTAAAAGGTVSAGVAFKQFCAWQALLHTSHGPALAGIVKWGGLAIMSKYLVGTAAVLALMLSGVQTYRMGALSHEVSELRAKANAGSALEEKVGALEKDLGETRGDAAALKANMNIRNDEVAQIEKRLKGFEQFYGGVPKVALNMDRTGPQGQTLNAYRNTVKAQANDLAAEQAAATQNALKAQAAALAAQRENLRALENARLAEAKAEEDQERRKREAMEAFELGLIKQQQQDQADAAAAKTAEQQRRAEREAVQLKQQAAADEAEMSRRLEARRMAAIQQAREQADAAKAEQAKLKADQTAADQAKAEMDRQLRAVIEYRRAVDSETRARTDRLNAPQNKPPAPAPEKAVKPPTAPREDAF